MFVYGLFVGRAAWHSGDPIEHRQLADIYDQLYAQLSKIENQKPNLKMANFMAQYRVRGHSRSLL